MGETDTVTPGDFRAALRALKKWLLIAAGTACLCLGVAGIFLPLLPTTPFLLLAAACYAGSSDKFYRWLMGNRWFGSYIRNYREGRGLTMKVKLLSVSTLWLTIGYSAGFVVQSSIMQLVLIVIAIAVTAHILSRPTFHDKRTA